MRCPPIQYTQPHQPCGSTGRRSCCLFAFRGDLGCEASDSAPRDLCKPAVKSDRNRLFASSAGASPRSETGPRKSAGRHRQRPGGAHCAAASILQRLATADPQTSCTASAPAPPRSEHSLVSARHNADDQQQAILTQRCAAQQQALRVRARSGGDLHVQAHHRQWQPGAPKGRRMHGQH